jgi:anti-anti-sigma regulatory factor
MTQIDAARDGAVLAGRSHAQTLREEIEDAARADDVVVDFSRVLTMSPSFADELFAKLDSDLVETGRVDFQHLSPAVRAIADFVISGRRGSVAT